MDEFVCQRIVTNLNVANVNRIKELENNEKLLKLQIKEFERKTQYRKCYACNSITLVKSFLNCGICENIICSNCDVIFCPNRCNDGNRTIKICNGCFIDFMKNRKTDNEIIGCSKCVSNK